MGTSRIKYQFSKRVFIGKLFEAENLEKEMLIKKINSSTVTGT